MSRRYRELDWIVFGIGSFLFLGEIKRLMGFFRKDLGIRLKRWI